MAQFKQPTSEDFGLQSVATTWEHLPASVMGALNALEAWTD